MKSRSPSRFAPLSGAEAHRLLAVGGLLARVSPSPWHAASAAGLLRDKHWQSVPLTGPMYFAYPLIVHHVERLGLVAADVFAEDHALAIDPPSFESLMRNACLRRWLVREALTVMAEAGVTRVMLIKGAALAPLWPSPALRDMEDVDLVVSRTERPLAVKALESAGWNRSGFAFSKPGAGAIDLGVPAGAFGKKILRDSLAHPRFEGTIATLPRSSDHLALIALHAAHHRGTRIWRDMVDWLWLTDDGEAREAIEGAFESATLHGHRGTVAAMNRIANRWFQPEERLATRGPNWTEAEESEARRFAELYAHMLRARMTEFPLRVLQSVALERGSLVRAVTGRLRRKPAGRRRMAARPVVQKDLLAGVVGAGSPLRRQLAKAVLLAEIWRSGQWSNGLRLARLAEPAVALRRPFEDSRETAGTSNSS